MTGTAVLFQKHKTLRSRSVKTKRERISCCPARRYIPVFTSDFFLDAADEWRREAWRMMRDRPDLDFFIITKRIDRFHISLPEDWGAGYDNVTIYVTAENQAMADYRLPILYNAPIHRKGIVCEPILGKIDLSAYLGKWVQSVVVGGESGGNARICDYDWVLDLRSQCLCAGVPFHFKQTGARFRKDGKVYNIERRFQHSQARKAGIDVLY